MDSDLFQILTLSLLVCIFALLIAVVGLLGSVKRSLDASTSRATSPHDHTQTPERTESEPSAEATTTAQSPPVREKTTRAGGAVEPAVSTVPDGPRDQPFEHEGRWWFRRGESELLVYDEWAAEWKPVESTSARTDTAATEPTVTTEATSAIVEPDTVAPSAQEPIVPEVADAAVEEKAREPAVAVVQEEQDTTATVSEANATEATGERHSEGFWKCSSCGAINGMKAATCRLCFAARN